MSRFNKQDVHDNWTHSIVTEGFMKGAIIAHGQVNGEIKAVYVSHLRTRANPIPEIRGKYLLNRGILIFDDEGFMIERQPFFMTKHEFFADLKQSGYDVKVRGIQLLIMLVAKIINNKAEELKSKTKKEIVHTIIDEIGDSVEADVLTFENVAELIDSML